MTASNQLTDKVDYFESVEKPKHRDFINAQSNCVLCGTVLELKHFKVESTESDKQNQIQEEAFCPQCEVKTRAKLFVLN